MRRREYDVVRGLAVIFMIAVHVLQTVYDGGSTVVYRLVDFLGSAPVAPVFMFLLGCNVLTSRHSDPRGLFMRGLKIFFASYAFNAVCHALPYGVSGVVHATPGWGDVVIAWLFAVDILTFAGLAFMVLAVVRKLKLSPAAFLIVSLVLHVVGTLLNGACPIPFEENRIGAGLLSIFYNASTPGYFSFLAWIIYPAAGMFFADMLRRVADEERLWRWTGIVAGIVFAGMLAAFCALPSVHGPYYADEYVYYRNGYFLLVHNLAFVVAWLALWHFLCRRFERLGTGLLLLCSRHLTKIYVMQWFFIGAFLIAPFGETLKLGVGAYLAIVVGILCLCIVIVRGKRASAMPSTAIVSLGSNIEPRARYLADALAALAALPQTRLTKASGVIETDPMEVPDEFADRKFLNQVAVFATSLEVREFSRRMHQIEDDLGRVRTVRNGPRTIDIDLIDFDGLKLDEPELTLPHPRAKTRPFVTLPLAELGITL